MRVTTAHQGQNGGIHEAQQIIRKLGEGVRLLSGSCRYITFSDTARGLAVVSFLVLLWFAAFALSFGVPYPGVGTIAFLIALLFCLIFLSVLAEYVARIFTETLHAIHHRHGVRPQAGLDHGA